MMEDVKCPNCTGYLAPGDKFCRFCGSFRGAGPFEPRGDAMSREKMFLTVPRKHECRGCGHKWETDLTHDHQRYCPMCGHDTYPDVDLSRICEGETWPFSCVTEAERALREAGIIGYGERLSEHPLGDVWWQDYTAPCTKAWLFNGVHPDYPGINYTVNAEIHDERVFFDEYGYERCWGAQIGDRLSAFHTIGGSAFEAFKAELGSDRASLCAAIYNEFSGPEAIKKLKSFCLERGIEIRSSVS